MAERTAIVMSGGGCKGAFQVGALKRLYENGVRPQIVCGTSVGSLNGAKIAENTPTAVAELEALWRSVQGNQDVLAWNPAILTLFATLGKLSGTKIDDLADLSGLEGALEQALIRRLAVLVGTGLVAPGLPGIILQVLQLLGLRRRVVDVVAALHGALDGESLFVTDPLRAKIVQYLNVETVRASGIEFRATGVDFQTGELVLMDQHHPDLVEAILASSVMPVFMEPRHPLPAAAGQPPHQVYDGGLRAITPLQVAIDLGAEHVYMILAGSLTIPEVGPVQGIFPITMRTLDIILNEIVRNDVQIQQEVNRLADLGRTVEDALPPTRDPNDPALRAARSLQEAPLLGRQPVRLTVIEPRIDPFDGSLDFDPAKIAQAIAHGYEVAGEV